MKLCLIILAGIVGFFTSDIYSIRLHDAGGSETTLAAYKGKKILVVNIATGSDNAVQLQLLQQLQQKYQDKLVVVAFPSNSFGNEQKTGADIAGFCRDTYGTRFPIMQQAPVTGDDIQPLYAWLTRLSENGVADNAVVGDYQKFLLDEKGNLVGFFAPKVNPLDASIQNAVTSDDE